MAKYICGVCDTPLKTQKIKSNSSEHKSGTKILLSHKVLIETTIRRYVCPNGCELKSVKH